VKTYIALLRAVNVGGTGKLQVADLKAMWEALAFKNVRTYIASGNVIFTTALSESSVKEKLENALRHYASKPVGVLVRTAGEMAAVNASNPFSHEAGNRVVAIFLDAPSVKNALETITGRKAETLALGTREIYVHYGEGIADSKLKIPAAQSGTARNMNTVAKLAQFSQNQLATLNRKS
jgi:uncharacterized protein (DUF1697 family)